MARATKKKTIKKQDQEPVHTISPRLQEEFLTFLKNHPVKRINRNLHKVLSEFLMYEGSIEADYLPDLLFDMLGLFNLLEVVHDEWKIADNATIEKSS